MDEFAICIITAGHEKIKQEKATETEFNSIGQLWWVGFRLIQLVFVPKHLMNHILYGVYTRINRMSKLKKGTD